MVGSIIVAALASAGGAFVTAAGALTALGAAAAIAINFAVSTIVNRLFAPKLDGNQNINNREQVPPTTDNSIPVVYGDAFLGGTFVDAALSKDQKDMYYVFAISCISPNGQFTFDTTKFYYGGRLITFGGTGQSTNASRVVKLTDDAGNEDTKVDGNLWIWLYTSNQAGVITPINTTTTPDGVMNSTNLNTPFVWPASGRQMNGLAFAIVRLNYNASEGFTQLQPITFKVKHALNGTGVAKPGDVWYDYMTNSVYGCAVDAAFVDSTSVTTLNSYSDQTIAFNPYGGGAPVSQARYRINGVLTGNVSALDNIEKILNACDTWMTYSAATGRWSLVVNKPESAAFAFNDSNIVGEIRVSATDITQSVNQIEARFPFKENKDQPNFVFIQTPSNLLYPNEPVNKASVTYDLVNDSVQAQYLANRVLEQAREDLIVSFNTTYVGIQVDAGDVVSVTNSNYGWNAKLFRVLKVNEVSMPDGNLGARLEMSEYSAGVYDDANITQYEPVPNGGITIPSSFPPLAAPTLAASRPNAQVPSFDVSVVVPTSGLVTEIALYYATVPTPTASQWTLLANTIQSNSSPYTPGQTFTFLNLVLPAGTYYFGFIVANGTGRSVISATSASFVWAPVTTGSRNTFPTVYQWSITQPPLPTGTSTFTWATGVLTYDNTDAWRVTAPTNPGTPGSQLWEALKWLNDTTGTAVSTFDWEVGGTQIQAISQNSTSLTPRTANGYLYYTIGQQTAPAAPTASNYNFDTATFGTLSANWTFTFNMPNTDTLDTRNNRYWAVRFTVTEATYGGTQTVNISSVFRWTNFEGLITFTNIGTPGATYIDGSHVITQTLTVDTIKSNTITTQNNNTFGFGTGSVIAGIATVGYFKTTRSDTAALAALSSLNVAFASSTVSETNGSAIFGNRWGYGVDDLYSGYNRTVVGLCNNIYGGFFQYRTQSALVSASAFAPDANTRAWAKIAFEEGFVSYAGQFFNEESNYYAVLGSPTFAIYAVGPVSPFTGSHDGLLDKTVTPEPGDILIDDEVVATSGIIDTTTTVTVSNQPNQKGVIGVYVGESDRVPATMMMNVQETTEGIDGPTITTKQVVNPVYEPILDQYRPIVVAALGEGQMNVCGLGGNIEKGDLIVTSAMPGKGMKQADDIVRGYTVAKARQDMTFADPNEVKLISVIYLAG